MGHVLAREMKLKLNGLKIDIVGTLNPGRFMGTSYEERSGFKEIKVVIKPDMEADDATIEEWLKKVHDRCPVGDNIQNETPVILEIKR